MANLPDESRRTLGHTVSEFDTQLGELRSLVRRMSDAVLTMLDDGLRGLTESDQHLATTVPARDDQIDGFEIAVDKLCTQILATWQPAASDLRYVAGTFKVVTDLERAGDLASHVGELAAQIRAAGSKLDEIPASMMLTVRDMLSSAIWSLQELDPQRAEQVSPKDEIVDRLYRETLQSLTAIMRTQPERTEECTLWMFLAKHLERIGDHATNIAETVIYMARGEDIRHTARGSSPSRP